jgi:hypothetical protein
MNKKIFTQIYYMFHSSDDMGNLLCSTWERHSKDVAREKGEGTHRKTKNLGRQNLVIFKTDERE